VKRSDETAGRLNLMIGVKRLYLDKMALRALLSRHTGLSRSFPLTLKRTLTH